MSARAAVARACRGVTWYLREVSGESAYDRYVAHETRVHPDTEVLSRRRFERQRQDLEDTRPQQRCC